MVHATTQKQARRAAQMAAKWWGDRLRSGDREAFEEFLAMELEMALMHTPSVFLECDYDPQGILLQAVRAAGVECSGFMFSAKGILPTKHDLTVRPDRLEPKEGYGNWVAHIPVPTT